MVKRSVPRALAVALLLPAAAGAKGAHEPEVSPQCPASTLSTTDPNLTLQTRPDPSGQVVGSYVDGSSDQPTDPTHTLSFTVNLTKCIRAKGASGIAVGEAVNPEIEAS